MTAVITFFPASGVLIEAIGWGFTPHGGCLTNNKEVRHSYEVDLGLGDKDVAHRPDRRVHVGPRRRPSLTREYSSRLVE